MAIRLLPLPVEIPAVPPARSGELARLAGLSPGQRALLFLGRVHYLKGLDLLIEAVEPLLGDDLKLVVAGRDDGHLDEVRERFAPLFARGEVCFVGPVYGEARFLLYAEAAVFCLTPRHWEETSVAALEAAACGTPVVVSEQADIPGLEAAGGGFVVPAEPDAIRNAVEMALADAEELGMRAREHVRGQHAAAMVVDQLERYLSEVTNS